MLVKLLTGIILSMSANTLFASTSINYKITKSNGLFKSCTYDYTGLKIERGVSGLVTQEYRPVVMTESSKIGFDQMIEDVYMSPSSAQNPPHEPIISTIEVSINKDQSYKMVLKNIVNSTVVEENASEYREGLIDFMEIHCK